MKKYSFFIFVFLSCLLSAQGFKVRHFIPHAADNSSKALYEVSPGNYIAAGFITDTSSGASINCLTIMGLGNQGQLQWVKKYKGHKFEYLNNGFIQRCFYKKNNFLFYAGCVIDTANKQIGVLIKFDMNGDTLWQKIYRDSASVDLIPQIVTNSVDGGFLITGFFQDWINNTRQGLILKTDGNGKELWRRKLNKNSPNVQDGKGIVQDSASKKIAIVGYQYIGGSNIYDNLLILDSLGVKLKQSYSCYFGGMGTDLIQTQDKKLVMVGWQYYAELVGSYNCMRSYAMKFDINDPLNPIWKINGYDKLGVYNGFSCVTELKNGDLLMGGFMDTIQGVWNGPNNQPGNVFTRLTVVGPNGNIKWNRYYDYKVNSPLESNGQGIHSINTCQDGGWLAAIEGYNYPGVNPFLFVKYDSLGCDSSLAYCATINPVGLKEFKAQNNLKFKIYPNPAKDFINIETNSSEETELLLTDISGREVKRLKINKADKIDVSELSKGIYLMQLIKNSELVYSTQLIKE